MSECCCVMYPRNELETFVRDAIDTNNQSFFDKKIAEGKKNQIALIKIYDEYSILEYVILRYQKELLAYFLNDDKWSLQLLQNMNNLSKVVTKVCNEANRKQILLQVEAVWEMLELLEAKNIPINFDRQKLLLDAPAHKNKLSCNLM